MGRGEKGRESLLASTNEGCCLAQCRNLSNVIECQMFPHSSLPSAKTPALQATSVQERDMHSQTETILMSMRNLLTGTTIHVVDKIHISFRKKTSLADLVLVLWVFGPYSR